MYGTLVAVVMVNNRASSGQAYSIIAFNALIASHLNNGGIPIVGGLAAGPIGGILGLVVSLLQTVLNLLVPLLKGLPVVGSVVGGAQGAAGSAAGSAGGAIGGLDLSGLLGGLEKTVTGVLSGIPIVGGIAAGPIGGILGLVISLLQTVLNLLVPVLKGLPVIGGVVGASKDCLQCICELESGCAPIGCNMDQGTLSCGYFQIKLPYYIDCGTPGQQPGESTEAAWKRCADDYSCAVQCVESYINRYAGNCPGKGYCERMSRLHNGGPNGCNTGGTDGYWRHIQSCCQCN
ncbi:hypothetical protein QR680_015903 [Steinernema hermaphroditum]|uniref:lysozyme n=1 Tax=Steinernema hermaphroditum TaxID=289476 RepID=A0AA39H9C7_9BILA|nr:hypothetical protein QR680_015903 [Steinernema hermaphroditum]